MGLEALLGPRVVDAAAAPAAADGEPHTLALDQLQPGRYQPRTRMDEGALYELAESIKAQGVMQPSWCARSQRRRRRRAALRDHRRRAPLSAPRGWPASTTCRCWCATSPTRPPRRWR